MAPSVFQSMAVLSLINFVDSISYMAVAPSLIFYVYQVGGGKEIYGLIMSAFSFTSFLGKPVYGLWVDKGGNKFRMPYVSSFCLAIFGAFVYFFANGAKSSNTALGLILVGRLFSGIGGANQALGYAYIASVVPHEQQTKTNSILSMMRIVGMAVGPAVNVFLAKIHSTISIGSVFTMQVDPLNAVGLLLAAGNLFTMMCVIFFLDEPPEKKKLADIVKGVAAFEGEPSHASRQSIWKAVSTIEIWLPIFILLVVNSSFQLIETALPPAAADGLGWGPVQTSAVLGTTSFVIFFGMVLTIFLSGKVHDTALVGFGNICWIIGGLGMYLYWQRGTTFLHYVLPVMVACMGFPFIAAANRSNFTRAVACKPELEEAGALMQSILSMSASVAGFVTPGFVATYIIRSSEQVTASSDNRELTALALYVPILSFLPLAGLWVSYRKEQQQLKKAAEEKGTVATEATGLLPTTGRARERRRSSVIAIDQAFSRQSEVNKRISGQIMGFTSFETKDEKEFNQKLHDDLTEWEELAQLEYD